jgi:predicted ester cyclase
VPETGVSGSKGEARGREGLGQFMELLTIAFPDFEITVLDMLTGEDLSMYEVRLTMTHEGPLGGLPPTGRRVDIRGASVLRLENGLIEEHRFHTNMQDSAEQLGLTFPAVLGQLPKLLLGKVRSPR